MDGVVHAVSRASLTLDQVLQLSMERVVQTMQDIRTTMERYRPCAAERSLLAQELTAMKATYTRRWQRGMRKEASRMAKWYKDQSECIEACTNAAHVENTLKEFSVEIAALEEQLRKYESAHAVKRREEAGEEGKQDAPMSLDERIRMQLYMVSMVQHVIQRMLETYHMEPPKAWERDINTCECGLPYEIIESDSQKICPQCQVPKPYVDVLRIDENTTVTRRQIIRKTNATPETTFRNRLDRAQFKEPPSIPRSQIVAVAKDLIKHGHTNPDTLTIPEVFVSLKRLGMSSLYRKVPQVHSRLTGRLPQQLTSLGTKKIMMLFRLLSRQYASCRGDRKHFVQYDWFGLQHLKLLERIPELPEEERMMYTRLKDSFRDVRQMNTAGKLYRILERMMWSIGIDTNRRGLVMRPLSETGFDATIVG